MNKEKEKGNKTYQRMSMCGKNDFVREMAKMGVNRDTSPNQVTFEMCSEGWWPGR